MADIHENLSHPNVSQNNTDNQDYTSIAILSSLAVAIAAINSLVFYLFFKNKGLRTPSNYPLFSLAACDLFTGVVNIPFFTINSFTSVVKSELSKFYLGFLVIVLHIFMAIATVYHIVVITTERYMAIRMPLRHMLVSKKCISRALCIVWLVAAGISFIPFSWINTFYPVRQPMSMKISFGYAIFCLVVVILLPFIFLIVALVVMYKEISARLVYRNSYNHYTIRQRASERKCIALFATMAIAFLACWFPWFLGLLLTYLPYQTLHESYQAPFSIIRYTTSIVNPSLYTLIKRDFHQALKDVFTGRRRKGKSLAEVITPSRRGTAKTILDQEQFQEMLPHGDWEQILIKESYV